MVIFKYNDIHYIYIHIPKNNGKYIRKLLSSQFKIERSYWNIEKNTQIDLAHIPYSKINKYTNIQDYKTFSFIRNPYDRIISAFFYRYPYGKIQDLQKFIDTVLINLNFIQPEFTYHFVHFFPQHLFIGDTTEIFNFDNIVPDTQIGEFELKMYGLKVKHYDITKYLTESNMSTINTVYSKDIAIYNSTL